jgi:signal transduction histidine kinase
MLKWFRSKLQSVLINGRMDLSPVYLNEIKTLIIATLVTTPLMWTYSLITYFHCSSDVLFYIGIATATIHLTAPLLVRYTRSITFPTLVMLGGGIAFQASYTYFDGGFTSEILVWFGVIPFLAGICDNKRAVYILGATVVSISLFFLVLNFRGYPFPETMSADGRWYAHLLMVFGWIFLSFFAIVLYLQLEEFQKRQISEANQNTNDLLRILIHDISNPLTVAGSSADLIRMKGEKGNSKSKKNMDRINSSLKNINQIVHKVKEMHAIQSGKAKVNFEEHNLLELVNEVNNQFLEKLEAKNLTLKYDSNELSSINLMTDPVLFKFQILSNIISNAIKFSQPGDKIEISITPMGSKYVEMRIRDFGVGMPKEIRSNLFREQVQTSRKGTEGEKGTGFGMILMKVFLDALNSDVSVISYEKDNVSNESSGTTFILTLPCAAATEIPKKQGA